MSPFLPRAIRPEPEPFNLADLAQRWNDPADAAERKVTFDRWSAGFDAGHPLADDPLQTLAETETRLRSAGCIGLANLAQGWARDIEARRRHPSLMARHLRDLQDVADQIEREQASAGRGL